MTATGFHCSQRRVASGVAVLCAMWACGVPRPAHGAEVYTEDSVKAAFIFRFAGYIEWPPQADKTQTFKIAVLGADSIAMRLQGLIGERTVHNRPARILRIASIRDATGVQILFIGAEHRGELRNLLSAVADRGMLVITDEEHGLDAGSTINFLMADRRVRFEVSTDAAHRAQLNVSSELLSVAARLQGSRYKPAEAEAP